MSNEAMTEDKETEELRQQIEQLADADKAKAAEPVIEPETPSPEPVDAKATEAVEEQPPVTPNQSEPATPAKDDPMEWAKKKGLKTPEDMARLLRQKEQEFHQSRQQKEQANQPPAPPAWAPAPQMGYGYPPQPSYVPQPRMNPRELAPYYPQLNPEDLERVMPVIVDAAEAISNRKMAALEQKFGVQFGTIQRQTERNNELMSLMQDPAFSDPRVQKEVHQVLDSDPSIFQRERTPLVYAYGQALQNMARKQLQQGGSVESSPSMGTKPPVTAGGGNGSSNTGPVQITEHIFDSWTPEQQKAFINSNGRITPKR